MPEYVTWDTTESVQLLWYADEMAEEKTQFIASHVNMLLLRQEEIQDIEVAFYFGATCNDSEAGETASRATISDFLQSMICHLLDGDRNRSRPVPMHIETVLCGGSRDIKKLWKVLCDVVAETKDINIYIVIDGIDSMESEDKVKLLEFILNLKLDFKRQRAKARFLISCVPTDDIGKVLKGVPVIDVEAERRRK